MVTYMTPNEIIKANITWLRKQHNLSQQQLADILEVKRSLLAAWEEGRSVPRYGELIAVSVYFNISVDELLRFELRKCYTRKVMLLPKLNIEME